MGEISKNKVFGEISPFSCQKEGNYEIYKTGFL